MDVITPIYRRGTNAKREASTFDANTWVIWQNADDGATWEWTGAAWNRTAENGVAMRQSIFGLVSAAGANLTATVAAQFQACGSIKAHHIELPTDAERVRIKPGKSTDSPSITNTTGTLIKGAKGLDFTLGASDEGFWFIRDAGMGADVTFSWTPGRV